MGWRAWVACAALAAGASSAQSQSRGDFELNIMGGPETGGFDRFAREISGMVGRCGVDLNVVESEGGLDNFLAVRRRPFTQFGISRDDVLEYMSTFAAEDPVVAEALAGVRVMMPLYAEQVHLFAGTDVESLQDLEGKRVSIGPPGSGTFITASLVLDLAGVEPAERVTTDFASMVPGLFAGEIDAAFGVFAAPVQFPGADRIDPEDWHFVPIEDPLLEAVYEPSTIPAGSYPFQPEAVPTVAARAVLLTFDYDPQRNAYHRSSCQAVSDVSHLMETRLPELQRLGHPAWQTVDPDLDLPGWESSLCAGIGAAEDYEFSCDGSAVAPVADVDDAYRARICSAMGIEC